MNACRSHYLIKIQRDSATSPAQRLANMADPMIGRGAVGRNSYRPFCLSIQSHLPLTQPCKAGILRENHRRGNEYADSTSARINHDKDRQQGSDRERSDCYGTTNVVLLSDVGVSSQPRKAGSPIPAQQWARCRNHTEAGSTEMGKRKKVLWSERVRASSWAFRFRIVERWYQGVPVLFRE
jgi:hypothetical protein